MPFLDKTGLERNWLHIISKLGNKVDKVDGKGLSTNDYTNEEKEKLANINSAIDDALEGHILNTSNPHNVTQTQLGIYVQDTEPTDVSEGAIWVDTSAIVVSSKTAIDTTLTIKGAAADAKTVGDIIAELQNRITALENTLNSSEYLVTNE